MANCCLNRLQVLAKYFVIFSLAFQGEMTLQYLRTPFTRLQTRKTVDVASGDSFPQLTKIKVEKLR